MEYKTIKVVGWNKDRKQFVFITCKDMADAVDIYDSYVYPILPLKHLTYYPCDNCTNLLRGYFEPNTTLDSKGWFHEITRQDIIDNVIGDLKSRNLWD